MARKAKTGAEQLDLFAADPTPIALRPEDRAPTWEEMRERGRVHLRQMTELARTRGQRRRERIAAGLEQPWTPPTFWIKDRPKRQPPKTAENSLTAMNPGETRAIPGNSGDPPQPARLLAVDTKPDTRVRWWQG